MAEGIRARLNYANVTATAAVVLALAGLGLMVANLGNSSPLANSAGATWFLAGSGNELPSCTSCEVSLPASGSGTWGSTQNTGNDQLSPDVPIVADHLSVRVDTAPGGAATRTFALFFRAAGAGSSLRCDISGSNTTCNSGTQSLTIPPRSALLVDAANSGNAPATKVQLSWRATAQ